MAEVLTKMDQLLQLPRRESATTTPALGMYVSFDERSHELITLEVESFGRLRREASEVVDWLATSVVGMGSNGQERRLRGTPSTGSFSDLSGCYLTPSSPVQARVTGPQDIRGGREGQGGLMPMAWVGT